MTIFMPHFSEKWLKLERKHTDAKPMSIVIFQASYNLCSGIGGPEQLLKMYL
jgi:hypothetical protein